MTYTNYQALKQTVTVQEGELIEIRSLSFKPGMQAEVIVLFKPVVVDESTEWTNEDISDLARHSMLNAEKSLGEE